MTAAINASTSSGVAVISDTSGNLALQSNGTPIVTATPSGLLFGSTGGTQSVAAFNPSTYTVYWVNNTQVTAGRASATVYQNTSGKTRYVLFAYQNFSGNIYIDNVNGSTTAVSYNQAGGGAPWNTTFIIVPNGYYYQFSGGTPTYLGWTEWQ